MFFIITFFPSGGMGPEFWVCVWGAWDVFMILREPWLGPNYLLMIASFFFFFKSLYENSLKTMLSVFSAGKYLLEGPPSIGVLFRGTSCSFLWIVFIYFIIFYLLIFFLFLAMLHNLGYLSTLTRNWTQVAFSGSTKSKPLVSQGISCYHFKSGLCIYSSIE